MTSEKIRHTFTKFFTKHGHTAVESSSLWPKDDPSMLLTTAGMQQFKPYFLGARDPMIEFKNKRLTSVQRCFRTTDIETVGDATHNTFFEMLGNFSIGDYQKEKAIDLAWEFLTDKLNIHKEKLWATYFKGDEKSDEDSEATTYWKKYLPADKIIGFGSSENWWGPPGASGPCGPCSEIHYDFTGQPCSRGQTCLPNCSCGRFMELWNLVFIEFHQNDKGKLKKLPSKNVDTGMGLERLALVLQKKKNIFETDLFSELISVIQGDKHFGSTTPAEDILRARIVADHLKGSVFMLADGISFSNKEQGYILRRIFRRACDQYLYNEFDYFRVAQLVIESYTPAYPYLKVQQESIKQQLQTEFSAYQKVLVIDVESVVKKITSLTHQTKELDQQGPSARHLSPEQAFLLYSTYGLSPERLKRRGFTFDEDKFKKQIEQHQELSRAGAKEKFGGHGLNSSEWSEKERAVMLRYHTATHLLHQALRDVLGNHVQQQGSDITPERLRFDFAHPHKLTPEEIKRVETIVNEKIKADLPVTMREMNYNEAIAAGALAFFKEKYPERVSVYSVGDYSRELCGGPHVKQTGELGSFRIESEKSSSAGIRRIKAVLS